MPRYIDADAIHYVEIGKGVEIALASDIDKIPTVSPDEVRGVGKWEMWEDYYGSNVYKCSVCGSDWDMIEGTPQDNDFNYCPNCGAKMEVSEDA